VEPVGSKKITITYSRNRREEEREDKWVIAVERELPPCLRPAPQAAHPQGEDSTVPARLVLLVSNGMHIYISYMRGALLES
jgi:hypothetical protein